MTFSGSALGSSRRRSTPPSNIVAKKAVISSHLLKIQLCSGWEGRVATFTNITEKVPTLLTFIVLSKIFMQIEKNKYIKIKKN